MTLHFRKVKIALVVAAIIIILSSLYFSHRLVLDLSREEKSRMEVWAEAMKTFNTSDMNTDLNLVLKVLNANNTIPVIVVDSSEKIQTYRNLDGITTPSDSTALRTTLNNFKSNGQKIRISLNNVGKYIDVYYQDSLMLQRLSLYPYLQVIVVLFFVLVAVLALLSYKKAEQNKVWVGLSKETAHQLGTPISSLMAWAELLKTSYPDDVLIPSMQEDIDRLQLIANRFSKIGSKPELFPEQLSVLLKHVTDYISKRTSDKVHMSVHVPQYLSDIPLNAPLFEWVIENLCKNAVDAMCGVGQITISVEETGKLVCIDVADTGKGISKRQQRDVFNPGYTTKARGWGLGLSLAKRIVEEYHSGRIYVKQSEINRGTIFRIELKK